MPYKTSAAQLACNKKYREAHPEKIKELNASYRKEHREELAEYLRNWRQANKHKAKEYEARRKPRDPAKAKARSVVNNAVKSGGISKPDVCSQCGRPDKPIHAHHYAGYDYLNWLNIVWLCPSCHREAHA